MPELGERVASLEARQEELEQTVRNHVQETEEKTEKILTAIQELRDDVLVAKTAGRMVIKIGALIGAVVTFVITVITFWR